MFPRSPKTRRMMMTTRTRQWHSPSILPISLVSISTMMKMRLHNLPLLNEMKEMLTPQDTLDGSNCTVDETVGGSIIGKCVEVYYAPFTFGHVRTARQPARTPVEEFSNETFSLQHLFLVALLHFVVLLPIILWLIPAPTTTEESKDAFTNGLGHLYSAVVHLYYGVYEAYCGFKEISVSFLLHPG